MASEDSLFYEDDLAAHKAAVAAWRERFAPMKSTMGAPLSIEEITRITLAWEELRAAVASLPERMDTPEMTEAIASLVGKCHATRRVIGDCWHAANRRAFPVERAVRRAAVHSAVADLGALGILKDEILDILNNDPKEG